MRSFVLLVPLAAMVLASPPLHADEYGDAVKAFRQAQKREAWKDRAEAYNEISFFDGPKLVGELLDAMTEDPHPGVKQAGLTVLSGLVSDEAREDLLGEAEKGRGERRFLALRAIYAQQGDFGKDRLLAMVDHKDPMVACQAVLALGRKRVPEAVGPLIACLAKPAWQVRSAAARAFVLMAGPKPRRIKAPSGEEIDDPKEKWIPDDYPVDRVLPPLIDMVEQAEGSERGQGILALERITKQDFGWDVTAWRSYAQGTKPEDIRRNPKYPPYLCGLPIYGQRPVVVFDKSLPTDDPHPFGTGTPRLIDLLKVPGARGIMYSKVTSRAGFLKEWTKRFVSDLEKPQRYEVILCGKQVDPILGKLAPASAGSQKKVLTALEELKLENGLDLMGALEAALDAGGKKDAQAWKKGPDVVILLCCSQPFQTKVTDQDEISGHIGFRAATRMVPVHTVGVGGHPWGMMRAISEASGGTYVNLAQ